MIHDSKTVIVTGGAKGIGHAVAKRFAQEGARIVIADVDAQAGRHCADELDDIAGEGRCIFIKTDVSKRLDVHNLVAGAVEAFGGIDILVNNAAVFDMGPIEQITEASYERVMGVNVKGLLFMLQAVAGAMIARGRGGKIINFASQAGRRGEPLVAVYCASKAAVISLTQSAGLALIGHRINVNGIAPGVVDTPMWDEVDALFARHENRPLGEKKRLVGEGVPFGRMGRPDDHVGCAIFLASAESDYVVAQTYNVDGGQWMS